jgi:hypothetical protein
VLYLRYLIQVDYATPVASNSHLRDGVYDRENQARQDKLAEAYGRFIKQQPSWMPTRTVDKILTRWGYSGGKWWRETFLLPSATPVSLGPPLVSDTPAERDRRREEMRREMQEDMSYLDFGHYVTLDASGMEVGEYQNDHEGYDFESRYVPLRPLVFPGMGREVVLRGERTWVCAFCGSRYSYETRFGVPEIGTMMCCDASLWPSAVACVPFDISNTVKVTPVYMTEAGVVRHGMTRWEDLHVARR